MALTKFLFPSLTLRAAGIASRLTFGSLLLMQIAFQMIRHPSLFDRGLTDASIRLSALALTTPIAIVTVVGLFIGYLATSVVPPGMKSPERWNIQLALRATAITVAGGLTGAVLFIPGLLLPAPGGYGLVAAGFVLGPWLAAKLDRQANRLADPVQNVSSDRFTWRQILVVIVFWGAVFAADGLSLLSVQDNRLQQRRSETAIEQQHDFDQDPADERTIRVVRLSNGLVRYRDLNSEGKIVILGFHGLGESLYEFPSDLEPFVNERNIRFIAIDRPGVGPISTRWPGYELTDWAGLVEEFDQKVLNGQPVSIIAHSGGGPYALACANLTFTRVLALVSSLGPTTYGSWLRGWFEFPPETMIGSVFLAAFPHSVVRPSMEVDRQQILHDWPAAFAKALKELGSVDGALITRREEAFRRNLVNAVIQGPESGTDDFRGMVSSWPLAPEDLARRRIFIFRGDHDQIIPRAVTDDFQRHVAPHATRVDISDMGHLPSLAHYERIIDAIAKAHEQEEQKIAAANPKTSPKTPRPGVLQVARSRLGP